MHFGSYLKELVENYTDVGFWLKYINIHVLISRRSQKGRID